ISFDDSRDISVMDGQAANAVPSYAHLAFCERLRSPQRQSRSQRAAWCSVCWRYRLKRVGDNRIGAAPQPGAATMMPALKTSASSRRIFRPEGPISFSSVETYRSFKSPDAVATVHG